MLFEIEPKLNLSNDSIMSNNLKKNIYKMESIPDLNISYPHVNLYQEM